MQNLFYKFQDMVNSGADSYGMLWYLGFVLLSSTFLLGAFNTLVMYIPLLMIVAGVPFLTELIMLIISFFAIDWLEAKIVTLQELKVILIIEGVLSLLLTGAGIIVSLINLICLMSIISIIFYLIEHYA